MWRRLGRALSAALLILALAATAGPAASEAREVMTVAVMPFEAHSPREEDKFLEGGIAETVTGALARVQSLQVIERAQLKRVTDELRLGQSGLVDERTAAQIGKLVAARHMALGSFTRLGSSMRINCRFVEVETSITDPRRGAVATRALTKEDDIFLLLDDLTAKVLASLEVTPSAQELQQIQDVTHATASPAAYVYYVQAREAYLEFSDAGYAKAVPLFERAVDTDPRYALAWAGLAETLGQWGWEREQNNQDAAADFRRALDAAKKAVALNPNLVEAQRALAEVYRHVGEEGDSQTQRLTRCMEAARKAIALNANDAEAHYVLFLALGKPLNGEGYEAVQRALTLNPRLEGARIDLADAYLRAGRLEEAMGQLDEALKVSPRSAAAWNARGSVLVELKRLDEAAAAYRKAIELQPDLSFAHAGLGYALGLQKKWNEAIAACRRALEIHPRLAFAHYGLAVSLAGKGDRRGATNAARKCLEIATAEESQKEFAEPARELLKALGAR
ncbi:MAG: tetratricopeptide repeat protein [Armatimonadetes bacterium]|nr:tetratricopeptide repeat protein [Armatimonadota bacterium]